ncbi:Gfo/Idh/MocA family protein [Corynebacterium sp. CCM 9203]|uniref:Gfo/Idh/MocA family protein n=1 Tax=Corynebacterium sp. CCM 9203 TaxID=3057615 RepID=UPI003526AAFE
MSNLVLVGCGGIARDGYIPAFAHNSVKNVQLVDPSPVSAKQAKIDLANLDISSDIFPSIDRLEEASNDWIVAVPPAALIEVARSIKRNRFKPSRILIEKPFGVNREDSERILGLLPVETSLFYMETFLHSNAVKVLETYICNKELGKVRSIDLAVKGNYPSELNSGWRGDRRLGGEVLHDWGVHSVGLVSYLNSLIQPALKSNLTTAVVLSDWERFGNRTLLTRCKFKVEGYHCDVIIDAGWNLDSLEGRPDVIVEFDDGTLTLNVEKKGGSSNWVCRKISKGESSVLAERSYRKELFVNGVGRFLNSDRPENFKHAGKFDPWIGLESLSVIDECYSQARRMKENSSF